MLNHATMTTPLSPSQLKVAREIDAEVVRLHKIDGDEVLLMGKFEPLMDALCEQFPGFGHLAKLLEAMASSIADGNFNDILGR